MRFNIGSHYKSFILLHLPVYIYAIGLFVLSSIPDLSPPDLGFQPQDKVYHFVFYASYAFFVARSFFAQSRWLRIKNSFVFYSIIFTALYGVSDEIHQYFVPGRVFSIFDILANSLGAIAGTLIFYYYDRYKSRKTKLNKISN